MKAELRTEWIEALRSGRYAQTRRALKDAKGYCCLAVLCDIVDPNGWSVDREVNEYRHVIATENELGITGQATVGLTGKQEAKLIGMNDEEGATFPQIADWIEANIPVDAPL